MNNLLVLARDSELGASRVWNDGRIMYTVLTLINDPQANDELIITAIRILDELTKSSRRVYFVFYQPFI